MENRRFSLGKSFLFARNEYIHWLTNPKMCILIVMSVFIYEFAIVPLIDTALEMDCEISVFEPFVALGTSGLVLLILPTVFVVLMSEYPRVQSGDWFSIIRIGRMNWLVGQVMFGLMTVISYVLFVAVCSIVPVLGRADITLSWSKVATEYTVFFPERYGSFVDQLLPENLYNQMSLGMAMVYTYIFLALHLIVVLFILLACSLCKKRFMGFVLNGAILSAGVALCSIRTKLMWLFPMAHSVVWLHYTEYYRQKEIYLSESVLYFGTVIVCLFIFMVGRIGQYQYDSVEV